MHLSWVLISGIYILIVIAVCLRIVYDTRSSTKTIAYLLLSIFLPVAGILFYLVFGVNYWKVRLYGKKSADGKKILNQLEAEWGITTNESLTKPSLVLENNSELAAMLLRELHTPLTAGNKVKLLVNGEEKFPEVVKALTEAKHHIHLEYYIYENDNIGKEIENILINKAKEGVQVKFIYDDFGESFY
jgi:cardiolipin synthase A/B